MTDAVQVEPGAQDRVRAEQIRLLYANGGAPMLVTLAAGLMLAALLVWAGTLAYVVALIWGGFMVAHTAIRQNVRRVYLRADPPDAHWRRWARRFTVGALAGGATWGVGALWLLAPGRMDLQMLVVAVLMAVVYGSMTGWGAYLPAFFVFFAPVFAPVAVWFALQGGVVHVTIAALFLLWIPTVAVLALRYNASLIQALQLRFDNAALAEDLGIQKQAVEQASLAKSRFLASASHDLRQPVHALGLFVGALRTHRLPKRSAALIDQIDASLAGLDSLFVSLLDISKLDAGVVQGEVCIVPLAPLLDRVCRDLAGEATAKGLTLHMAATRLSVVSDPVLLERILRNLVGNAVRYTETGGVVVGARRAGGKVSLEIWDTGPGIAPAYHDAIFEEFYQLANPDRDRAKGLGLGLSIVRRLATILNHDVILQSRPGKGAVFRVRAPRATTAGPEMVRAESLARSDSGMILAIDDEHAVRAGMAELMRSWGHRVIVVSGGQEALALLTEAPDLIICDYRLRGGDDGITTIRALQARFGSDIPAILVTGDTAADRLREAEASGYPLLHKPLSPARLRAAVTSRLQSLSSGHSNEG